MDYNNDKEIILQAIITKLKSMRSGQKTCVGKLCRELFPDTDFAERTLLELNNDLFLLAEENGLYLDTSEHDGLCEGMPYYLDFKIRKKSGSSKKSGKKEPEHELSEAELREKLKQKGWYKLELTSESYSRLQPKPNQEIIQAFTIDITGKIVFRRYYEHFNDDGIRKFRIQRINIPELQALQIIDKLASYAEYKYRGQEFTYSLRYGEWEILVFDKHDRFRLGMQGILNSKAKFKKVDLTEFLWDSIPLPRLMGFSELNEEISVLPSNYFEIINKVNKMARKQGFFGADFIGSWKDNNVYEPYFADNKEHTIGLPMFFLEQKGKIRITSADEAFEFMYTLN